MLQERLLSDLAAMRQQLQEARRGWNTGTPEVKAGSQSQFWCAVKETPLSNITCRLLCYGNAYEMPASDTMDSVPDCAKEIPGNEDEYEWTGWWQESCDQCETFWMFSGDVIAWMDLPDYAARTQAEQPDKTS